MSKKVPVLPAAEYNRMSKIEENFKILKKYEDARFGPVAIIEVPGNNRKLMVKEKVFNSKKELTNEIYAIKKRVGLSNPNLLHIVDYSTGSRSDFCASFFWIKIYFEYPDHDLDQELKRRARYNISGLNGDELTHMLYQVSDAGAFLSSNGINHMDICPETIEMDNPERYRLVEKFGDIAKPEVNQQNKIFSGTDIHLAPELYNVFRGHRGKAPKGGFNPNQMEKSDVFSLGLTMIQAGIDQSVQGYYDVKKGGRLNDQVLENYKKTFADRFGRDNNLLVTTVMSMVENAPEARPTFRAILDNLPPYDMVTSHIQQQKAQNGYNNHNHLASSQNYSASMYSTPYQQQNATSQYHEYLKQNAWETEWGNPEVYNGHNNYNKGPANIFNRHLDGQGHHAKAQAPPVYQPGLQPNAQGGFAGQQQVKKPQAPQANFGAVPQIGEGVWNDGGAGAQFAAAKEYERQQWEAQNKKAAVKPTMTNSTMVSSNQVPQNTGFNTANQGFTNTTTTTQGFNNTAQQGFNNTVNAGQQGFNNGANQAQAANNQAVAGVASLFGKK